MEEVLHPVYTSEIRHVAVANPGKFRLSRNVLYLVFALSGFSGLIYESIWTHYLKLFLGHAAYAQTLVLVIFMGGMAIGSWLCGKMSGRWRNLLLGYAVVEGIIGVFAMCFHGGFLVVTEWFFNTASPALGSPDAVMVAKWSLAALLILPQSVLLGMSFPLMSAGIIRRFPERSGETLATLYFVNSLGGVIGVLASGFVLIHDIGLPGTVMAAGVINLMLAAIIWQLSRKEAEPVLAPAQAQSPETTTLLPILLTVALLTGLSSFVYEIGWIRMLSLVLGSSTHAFELMLSSFILGLALGGLWVRRKIDGFSAPLITLGWIQVLMGLLALATLPLYGLSYSVMEWLIGTLPKTDAGYTWFNLSSHAIASFIMLPATFCAGMTLPLITHMLIKAGAGERSIGFVYGANTLGAIVGALLAVHVGLPLIGLKGLIVTGGAIDIALGAFLLWRWLEPHTKPLALSVLGISILFAGGFSLTVLDQKKMASGVFREGGSLKIIDDMVFYRDGKTASIAVTRTNNLGISLRTNGKTDAAIYINKGKSYSPDEVTMTMAGALPLILKPDARTVANIGLGSGITTHTLLASPLVTRVDTIEIEPAIREGAKSFITRNYRAFEDPRSNIIIEDAKTYFSTHNERYDIIVSEPSNPWISGVSGLFSVEFYRLVKRYMAGNGLFAQWLQVYEIDTQRMVSVMKALDENFSDYAIYATDLGNILIMATPQGSLPEIPPTLPDMPQLRMDLQRVDVNTPQDVAIRKLGDKKLFAAWLAKSDSPANSDYYPYLDQHAGRDRFMGVGSWELLNLAAEPLPVVEMMGVTQSEIGTTITASPYWGSSHPVFIATLVRDMLMGRSSMPIPANMPEADRRNAIAKAMQVIEGCRTPPNGNAVNALLNFALGVLPYLRPQENAQLMQSISSYSCVTMLAGQERIWLNLVAAVGQRNGKNMVESVNTLREAKLDNTLVRKRYLLATGMLGNLSMNRPSAALSIWHALAPQAFGKTTPPLTFQIMAAWSEVKHGEVVSKLAP